MSDADADADAGVVASLSRVLVVEDEPLLALDMAQTLEDAGYEVVGPATSVKEALRILERAECDAALLDMNLRNETSEPIAHALIALGKPSITLSGYSPSQRPDVFSGSVALSKPLDVPKLLDALRGCLSVRNGAAAP
jgi:DNA-binding response OmpR family regulator